MFTQLVILVAALASVQAAPFQKRDHVLTITNNCGKPITPSLTNTGGPFIQLGTLQQGQTTTTSVPENWSSGRVFGDDGSCSKPDGAACTLLECDFSNPAFRQCNLSIVSGFNVGMSFNFADAACGGNSCQNNQCGGNAAFTNPTDGGPSLRQCNDPTIGMSVSFC